MMVRRTALKRIGGIESIRGELIDDCALAARIKAGGRIWIGLTDRTRSIRPYRDLGTIWRMVARTAFRQLRHSWLLLVLTVVGLAVIYAVPPLAVVAASLAGEWLAAGAATAAYVLMARAYAPMARFYGLGPTAGLLLPVSAAFYALMTVDSARRHLVGKGGGWKARHYGPHRKEPA